MDQEEIKKLVGYRAVDDYVKSGMLLGLGTGSTAKYVVERIGQKLKSGELIRVVGIPTSEGTRKLAEDWNIPMTTLDERCDIDVAIDGADEVDSKLNLVKGRGGALLREKLVAQNAKQFVVVADASKIVTEGLGTSGAFPVEINKFSCLHVMQRIKSLKSIPPCKAVLRRKAVNGDEPYETDNQNYIVDLFFDQPLQDVQASSEELIRVVGVVEHGLFLSMAKCCIVGDKQGDIRIMTPS